MIVPTMPARSANASERNSQLAFRSSRRTGRSRSDRPIATAERRIGDRLAKRGLLLFGGPWPSADRVPRPPRAPRGPLLRQPKPSATLQLVVFPREEAHRIPVGLPDFKSGVGL